MKIIILRGKQNSGKTTTSALIYEKLLTIADTPDHSFNSKSSSANSLSKNQEGHFYDFTAVIIVGGKKIGIISAGDIKADLNNDIVKMIKINVEILICCTRSIFNKNSTFELIENDYASRFEILDRIWITRIEPFNLTDKMNKVNQIMKIIASA